MHESPPSGLGCCPFQGGGSVAVNLLFNVLPIVGGSSVFFFLFCYALLCVNSRFAVILKRKTKLVALLLLSYRCIVIMNFMWLLLTVPWGGRQCVIVVFPDHTHLLFATIMLLRFFVLFGRFFVTQYLVSCIFLRKRETSYFTFIVFLMSCVHWCSVFLPHSAMGMSTVCDCRRSCHTPISSDIYQMQLVHSDYHLKLAESIQKYLVYFMARK